MSIRMPPELEKELKQFAREEKLDQTSDAARKLLRMGIEQWRKERALQLFLDGKCSFSKAAKIAQITVWEFADLVKERKTPWITDKEMLLEDIRAAQKG